MIREVKRDDIPSCVALIRSSFMTVADEYGLTRENAPGFTAFAISEERLCRQMGEENRIMRVDEEEGVFRGYYSLLIQENGECELNHLAVLPHYRHRGIGALLLKHACATAKGAGCHAMNIGIVEENAVLRRWYEQNGAIHCGCVKYDFFPFTCGYMKLEL